MVSLQKPFCVSSRILLKNRVLTQSGSAESEGVKDFYLEAGVPESSKNVPAFKRGEVIIESLPLAVSIDGRERTYGQHNGGVICGGCCKKGEVSSFERCEICKIVWFCSSACRKFAMDLYHGKECRLLAKELRQLESVIHASPTAGRSVRLLISLSHILNGSTELTHFGQEIEAQLCSEPVTLNKVYGDVKSKGCVWKKKCLSLLTPRIARSNCVVKDNRIYVCALAFRAFQSNLAELTSDEQKEVFSLMNNVLFDKVVRNSFTIVDGDLAEVGVGIYPFSSFLNHSCLPNCLAVYDGVKQFIVAARDVDPGEELCIAYVDNDQPTEEFQRSLRDQYKFVCSCSVCCSKSLLHESYTLGMNEAVCPQCAEEYRATILDVAKSSQVEGGIEWITRPSLLSYDWFHVFQRLLNWERRQSNVAYLENTYNKLLDVLKGVAKNPPLIQRCEENYGGTLKKTFTARCRKCANAHAISSRIIDVLDKLDLKMMVPNKAHITQQLLEFLQVSPTASTKRLVEEIDVWPATISRELSVVFQAFELSGRVTRVRQALLRLCVLACQLVLENRNAGDEVLAIRLGILEFQASRSSLGAENPILYRGALSICQRRLHLASSDPSLTPKQRKELLAATQRLLQLCLKVFFPFRDILPFMKDARALELELP